MPCLLFVVNRNLIILLLLIGVCVANSFAMPITFTYTATGTGSIGGTQFTNALFTITATGDTANRQSFNQSGTTGFFIDHNSASILIAGIGAFQFTSATRTFVNNTHSIAGFSRGGVNGADLLYPPLAVGLAGWDMLSSFGPIAGNGTILQWGPGIIAPVMTTGGVISINNGTPFVTFQAAIGGTPSIQITLTPLPPNDQYVITATPTMPTIRATAKIINTSPDPTPNTTFTWNAHLSINENGGSGPAVSYDQDIIQGQQTIGLQTYTLTFQDPSVFRGGNLTLIAKATVNGQMLMGQTPSDIVINGTNPQRSAIQSAVDTQVPPRSFYGLQHGDVEDVIKRIGCQESGQRQFTASANGGQGPPHVSFDNGIGIFQITGGVLFSTQPALVFNWMQNVNSGVTTYQTKVKTSLGYPGLLRGSTTFKNFITNTINPARVAAGLAPITTVPAPNFTMSGTIGSTQTDQLLEDGVRGYNGFAGPAFLGISVLHEFEPDVDFLKTVPNNQLPTLSTNPSVWKRVCTSNCSAVRGPKGDPDYVQHVTAQSPLCGG